MPVKCRCTIVPVFLTLRPSKKEPTCLSSASFKPFTCYENIKRFLHCLCRREIPLNRKLRHLRSRTGRKQPTGLFSKPSRKSEKEFPYLLYASKSDTSIAKPGPIVEVRLAFFKYVPLTPLGFALAIAPTKATTFSLIASSLKLVLPTPA